MPKWTPNQARFYTRKTVQLIRKKSSRNLTPNLLLAREAARLKEGQGWTTRRTWEEHYNPFFSYGLREAGLASDLLELVHRKAGKKRFLRVLEDGAGSGEFLATLKQKASQNRIRCHTTAVSLTKNSDLQRLHREGMIDEIRAGFAETFVPQKPFDLIVSMFGSLHYTEEQHNLRHYKAEAELGKNHLLKMAHCLGRGGMLLAGFNPLYFLNPRKRANLIASFRKRGFEATIVDYPRKQRDPNKLPGSMLILQRIR